MAITSYGFIARVIFIVVLSSSFLSFVSAHGYVIQPASRASLWRLEIPGSIVDMDDNQLYCGGFQRQWNFNDGKCGICGDDYSLPQPRPYENMGARSRGIVVGTYEEGTVLPVTVTITASHKGNSLGVCDDGKRAVGCGPQETFRTCSDVAILPKGQIHKRLHVPGFGWKLAKPTGKISPRALSPVTKNPIHESA
ncbi:hypothetical protein J437_LFUL005586 [Ladona fulva]|uniref:Chitin-binding type-4 domain-containing protein n=1 Tax=Ladona fulva TaxID=123851 RepID=A0A8K0JX28_LADFU|nr:hypothetical protein J437_LFUL005586 [Ladona fulva]